VLRAERSRKRNVSVDAGTSRRIAVEEKSHFRQCILDSSSGSRRSSSADGWQFERRQQNTDESGRYLLLCNHTRSTKVIKKN